MSVVEGRTPRDRPAAPARPEYRPGHPQELFIVPLLKAWIEGALNRYAGSGSTIVNKSALDVGCGRQPFRRQVEALGFSYAGTDARQTPEGSVDFVALIDGELPEGLERAAPFGLILCTELMEHVADWKTAFANLARLTDVGGIVILTCPFVFPLHEEPYDFWRPTPHALRQFATDAGFAVVESEKAGTIWDVLGTVIGCVRTDFPGPSLVSRFAGFVRRRTLAGARWAVRKRIPHRLLPLAGPVYLSNLLVLEKR
jgi:SAM-dependent methyltransferase